MAYQPISPSNFAELGGEEARHDWRYSLGMIRAEFRAGTFQAAGEFAASIAALADEQDHHPDINLRWPDRVRVAMSTHAVGGLSDADVRLSGAISSLAAERGVKVDRGASSTQMVEIAIDAVEPAAIAEFWAAALDYGGDENGLNDPRGEGPPVWFQQIVQDDRPRTQRNHFHLDIAVPHDQADARISAVLSAGGTMVFDDRARAFWTLADAEGNEACICTWQDR